MSLTLFACTAEVGDTSIAMNTGAAVHAALTEQGFSCAVQNAADELSEDQWVELRSLLKESYSVEQFAAIVGARETGCREPSSFGDVGVIQQGLASVNAPHNVEPIDVDGTPNSPVSGTGIDVDDASTSYMCGYDPGYPADLIWEFNQVPYSSYYRTYLRYDGVNGFGNCVQLVSGTLMARVYTDDSIRMCVGGSTANWCLAYGSMSNSSFRIGFD